MPDFVPGQRWVSETEPELGLGTILHVEDRRVSVRFPAADETRCYASASPPLARAIFHVGDSIAAAGGKSFVIEAVQEANGLFIYEGEGIELLESHMGDVAPCPRPEDRLLRGQADSPHDFALRCRTWRFHARIASSPVHGFTGCRIDLIPHQLYIAHAAAMRIAPRLLLADEVGLGKTIEACLILHRLLLTGRIARVLILVPEVLLHQWLVELMRRFNIHARIYDETRCDAIEESSPSQNPFLDEQLVLAPTSLFKTHGARRDQALAAGWDFLIVDEAHHLSRGDQEPGSLYRFVDSLAAIVPSVLLLTATPGELGPEHHFARLRILDPERYPDLDTFLEESQRYADTAKEAEARLAKGESIDELLDRYGPGRVMFRNTRRRIQGFPERRLHATVLDPGASRQKWLAEQLRSLKEEKVLLICHAREAVETLASELPSLISIPTALFHEDMNLIQRDRAAAWFAEPDGARLMIASEIGGEGRNFQFAHHLILYDLPENPEILEQRIGRLDRIGQRDTVHIHVPCLAGTREERILHWMRDGLSAFSQCLQGGAEIYYHFKDRLDGDLEELVADTKVYRENLERRLEEGTNRLLEMHSFDGEIAERIREDIRELDADQQLDDYLLDVLDHHGIHADVLEDRVWQLSPGPVFRDGLPGFRKEGMIATASRSRALDREDWTFLSWDHPLLSAAMESIMTSSDGSCTVVTSPDAPTPLCVEAVFVLEATAPPQLVAERFLPPTLIRVTLDMYNRVIDDFPDDLPDGRRPGLLSGDGPLSDRIKSMLDAAREQAEAPAEEARRQALTDMKGILGSEHNRLAYLASINDHVHPEELEQAAGRIERLTDAIETATIRIDAVRLVLEDRDGG